MQITHSIPCYQSDFIMDLFSTVEMAPRDPILGLNEAFNADTRTDKINLLGAGQLRWEEHQPLVCRTGDHWVRGSITAGIS